MTKHELLDKLDALRGTVSELPWDAQIISAGASDLSSGILKTIHLKSGIAQTAAALGAEELRVCDTGMYVNLYFEVDGVRVSQDEERVTDDA